MKTKILIAVVLFALNTILCIGQEKISIAIYQDVKLATIGDKKHNYDAFTLDMIFRLKMQGNQQKFGYLVVFPEFEIADLNETYYRYSANVGYTLNKLFIKNFEINGSLGYGIISRENVSSGSFSLNGEIAYKITDNFKISVLGQLAQRTDLKWLYDDNTIKFSGFFGIEYNIPIKN